MAIDAARDKLIDVHDLCELFPQKDGDPKPFSSVKRWLDFGVKPKHGIDPIRLEAIKVAGGWFTTAEAINEWVMKQTALANGYVSQISKPSRKRIAAIERRSALSLQKRGFKTKTKV